MVEYLLAEVLHAERLAAIESARRETEILRFLRRAKQDRPSPEAAAATADGRLAREVT